MKKKKFLALLLTGAMALAALTGCSSGTETTEESTGGDASAESGDGAYKIALIQQHQTNAFQIGVTEGAQAKADELGVELNILSADQDAAKQISQIEQCVSEGYDAILFEPVDPDGLRDAAKAAADAGVIMINIVSACTDWESAGISAVSCGDNVKAGENEMQHVADLLGGKGNIAILTGPSSTTDTTARLEGYRNILANYPDMTEVIAPADCAWDTAKAQSTVESWLSAYDLDAIVCQNDGMAVGAGNAAGANSGIVITGLDGTPDGYEAIKDGRITGTVAQDGGLMASSGVKLLSPCWTAARWRTISSSRTACGLTPPTWRITSKLSKATNRSADSPKILGKYREIAYNDRERENGFVFPFLIRICVGGATDAAGRFGR